MKSKSKLLSLILLISACFVLFINYKVTDRIDIDKSMQAINKETKKAEVVKNKDVSVVNAFEGESLGLLFLYNNKPMPIVKGSSNESLFKGIGLMDNSVDFGKVGQTFLAGHRETALNKLSEDTKKIKVKVKNKTFTYKIVKKIIVDKNVDKEKIINDSINTNQIVLITCYPLKETNKNPQQRYVVFANLIKEKKEGKNEK